MTPLGIFWDCLFILYLTSLHISWCILTFFSFCATDLSDIVWSTGISETSQCWIGLFHMWANEKQTHSWTAALHFCVCVSFICWDEKDKVTTHIAPQFLLGWWLSEPSLTHHLFHSTHFKDTRLSAQLSLSIQWWGSRSLIRPPVQWVDWVNWDSQQSAATNQASGEQSLRQLLDLMMEEIFVMPVISLSSLSWRFKMLQKPTRNIRIRNNLEFSFHDLLVVYPLFLVDQTCQRQLLLWSPHSERAPTSRQSLSSPSPLFSQAVR